MLLERLLFLLLPFPRSLLADETLHERRVASNTIVVIDPLRSDEVNQESPNPDPFQTPYKSFKNDAHLNLETAENMTNVPTAVNKLSESFKVLDKSSDHDNVRNIKPSLRLQSIKKRKRRKETPFAIDVSKIPFHKLKGKNYFPNSIKGNLKSATRF